VELFAPGVLARAIGLPDRSRLVAGYGIREIGTGIGILSADDPTAWIWSRVGGDGLDLATLAVPLAGQNSRKRGAVLALLMVTGTTLLDVLCVRALGSHSAPS